MGEVLLIVDDIADVARSFSRLFRGNFEKVYTASTPEEAEKVLGQTDGPPTALICDYWLGKGRPLGSELIARWRAAYPSLKRVALITGSQMSELKLGPGIDGVFCKPVDLESLRDLLKGAGVPERSGGSGE
jgi:CheY-like chemotaxis protein